jgi:formylmethanofuran:tetrahydromethanopterin formyltransferase
MSKPNLIADTMPTAFDMEVQRAITEQLRARVAELETAASQALVALTGGEEFISHADASGILQAVLHDGMPNRPRAYVAEMEAALREIAEHQLLKRCGNCAKVMVATARAALGGR